MAAYANILTNVALTIAVLSLGIVVQQFLPAETDERWRRLLRRLSLLVMGAVATLIHIGDTDDIIIDQSAAAITIATLFGGPLVGGATWILTAATRLGLGGEGAIADVIGTATDYTWALIGARYMAGTSTDGLGRFALLASVGTAVGLTEALALLAIPPFTVGLAAFQDYGTTLLVSQVATVLILGAQLGMQDAGARLVADLRERQAETERALETAIASLSAAMLHRDPTTAGHEHRASDLAERVGHAIGLSDARMTALRLAAMAHDVGQIMIPTEILTRSQALAPEEFALVKLHPQAGYDILKDIPFPGPVAEIVRQHHENYDGTGYPGGLAGEAILIEARIIRLCDTVEAMMSHRPYRRAFDRGVVLAHLRAQAGRAFDPALTKVVMGLLDDADYAFPAPRRLAAA